MQRECAEAALNLVRSNMTIGLTEGRITEYLIEFIQYKNMDVKVVTSSMNTALLCKKHEVTVVPTWMVDSIDIAFDECDQVDTDLNGLKSTTAMKIEDKIIASLAKRYVLMVDSSRFVDELTFEFPIMVEVIPEAYGYVKKQLEDMGASVTWKAATTGEMMYTDHGNIVLEAIFSKPGNIQELNQNIVALSGVVDTSLFIGLATDALIAQPDGSVKTLNK